MADRPVLGYEAFIEENMSASTSESKTSRSKSHAPPEPMSLKELRRSRGLSQREAAERIGVSRTLWSALEMKNRPLQVTLLNCIQDRFDLSDEDTDRIRRWWGSGLIAQDDFQEGIA